MQPNNEEHELAQHIMHLVDALDRKSPVAIADELAKYRERLSTPAAAPKTIPSAKKALKEAHKATQKAREDLRTLLGRQTLWCPNCRTSNKINTTKHVTFTRYVEPYSCTGGDYWKSIESSAGFRCKNCKLPVEADRMRNPEIFNKISEAFMQDAFAAEERVRTEGSFKEDHVRIPAQPIRLKQKSTSKTPIRTKKELL